MDYLLSKQDLQTFSPQDLTHISKYYDVEPISNQNDFLWMLAINIIGRRAQMPPGTVPDFKTLETLDDATLIEVAMNIDPASLSKLCRASNRFNTVLCANSDFWKRKYIKDYGEPLVGAIKDWKKLYKNFGRVWSFGSNKNGQLGLGDKIDRDIPNQITSLDTGIKAISAGDPILCY